MKLSVFLLAYNHERFIEQAVHGVLMQRTNFAFELIIGEDASTDGTAQIVRRLQAEYPNQIRATVRDHNVGMHRNFIESYQACTGEYVAFLDGDDYWIAPDKLQKQVAFLDSHPGYSMCFHNAHVRFEERDEVQGLQFENPSGRTTFELEDLIENNFVPSCSIVARNRLIDQFPAWLPEIGGVDWVFHLLNARHGSIGYLDEPMAVYRKHAGGVWSPYEGPSQHEKVLAVYARMASILDRRYSTLVRLAADRFRFWAGNEWLRAQVANCEAELQKSIQAYNASQAWIAQCDKERAFQAQQLNAAQALIRRLQVQARIQAEEGTQLRSRLQQVESSRGWRLLVLLRQLAHVLFRPWSRTSNHGPWTKVHVR